MRRQVAVRSDGHILGQGEYRYELETEWPNLPSDMELGDVAAVAVGQHDRVFLLTRGEHPVVVLSREGEIERTFGHGIFKYGHGLHIGADGSLYCTDAGDHTVRKCTPEGRILLELGMPGVPAPFMSGRPFNYCTHTALSPRGDIYVSDGYGNACIHKFDPDGRLLRTWGSSGCAPGEFYVPHNLVCDEAGWVYVADRENHRIQIFDSDGHFEAQWTNLHRPCALCRTADGRFYIGELGTFLAPFLSFPNLGPRLIVLDSSGEPLAKLAAGPAGIGPGRFVAPHGIAVDSFGDIYVGEVSRSAWSWVFPDITVPPRVPTLHKLRRIVAPASLLRGHGFTPQNGSHENSGTRSTS